MILSARITGLEGLAARLQRRVPTAPVGAALDATAARLARVAATKLGRAPTIEATAHARRVGSIDPAAVARETGTLATPPDPWLLPAVAALKAGDGGTAGDGVPDATPAAGTDGGTP